MALYKKITIITILINHKKWFSYNLENHQQLNLLMVA